MIAPLVTLPILGLLHPGLEPVIDHLIGANGWSWDQVQAGRAEVDGAPVTFLDLQDWIVDEDPMFWAETYLVDTDLDGKRALWKFFDYQVPSIRYVGHLVHRDAAEVGKTREIAVLALYGAIRGRGDVLITGNLDGDLDEIWRMLLRQLDQSPVVSAAVKGKKEKPYRQMEMRNGFRIVLRPSGHDGSALRGMHVGGYLLRDEAAKSKNEGCWSEFWRAALPGCQIRIYSVPDGDRTSQYHRLCEAAAPLDRVAPDLTSSQAILRQISLRRQPSRAGGRKFGLVVWPKSVMPFPFWSADREAELVEQFGGRHTGGFQRNVLALNGDATESPFPWRLLQPMLRPLPEYRSYAIDRDPSAARLTCRVNRPNPSYAVDLEDDVDLLESGVRPMIPAGQESLDLNGWTSLPLPEKKAKVAAWVRQFLQPVEEGPLLIGSDVGSSTLTEILIHQRRPNCLRLVARVQLRGCDWYVQKAIVEAIDEQLSPQGWAIDASGVGKVLYDLLLAEPRFEGRLMDVVFNRRVPAIDPRTGEERLHPQTKTPLTVGAKEQATQYMELDFQAVSFELPGDPEVLQALQSHVPDSIGSNGERIWRKHNDHIPDAFRALVMRAHADAFFAPREIVFHTGSPAAASSATTALFNQHGAPQSGALLEGY
ncbi:MAG TPA: hypothetical protein VGS22_16545 [Thermoanaerobaculia bacterium]|nr:hypothetical protein [Thermoanaerobaculia bacterium]